MTSDEQPDYELLDDPAALAPLLGDDSPLAWLRLGERRTMTPTYEGVGEDSALLGATPPYSAAQATTEVVSE